jgi:large subunit ribosomal protein L10
MRPGKQFLLNEVQQQVKGSPYLLLVDFTGLNVSQSNELRTRLAKASAEFHVVKNSVLKLAAKEAGLTQFDAVLTGPTAIVVGNDKSEVTAAAKVLKTFASEFDKTKLKLGFLGNSVLDVNQIKALADLPGKEALRAQFLGLLQAPAQRFVRVLAAKQSEFLSVLKQYEEKLGKKQ